MTDITIFPDRLTAMSEADLAALPAEQLREIHFNLAQLVEWVKKAQAKTHNAMKRRYAEQERAARSEAGKDFGTVHFQDGPIRVTVDTPKRVSWDQAQLAEMASVAVLLLAIASPDSTANVLQSTVLLILQQEVGVCRQSCGGWSGRSEELRRGTPGLAKKLRANANPLGGVA